jgi:hypothetical protein
VHDNKHQESGGVPSPTSREEVMQDASLDGGVGCTFCNLAQGQYDVPFYMLDMV